MAEVYHHVENAPGYSHQEVDRYRHADSFRSYGALPYNRPQFLPDNKTEEQQVEKRCDLKERVRGPEERQHPLHECCASQAPAYDGPPSPLSQQLLSLTHQFLNLNRIECNYQQGDQRQAELGRCRSCFSNQGPNGKKGN